MTKAQEEWGNMRHTMGLATCRGQRADDTGYGARPIGRAMRLRSTQIAMSLQVASAPHPDSPLATHLRLQRATVPAMAL